MRPTSRGRATAMSTTADVAIRTENATGLQLDPAQLLPAAPGPGPDRDVDVLGVRSWTSLVDTSTRTTGVSPKLLTSSPVPLSSQLSMSATGPRLRRTTALITRPSLSDHGALPRRPLHARPRCPTVSKGSNPDSVSNSAWPQAVVARRRSA